MALTNAYVTLAELKSRLGIIDAVDDWILEDAINAVSRGIDNHTDSRFWLDSAAVARRFIPSDRYLLGFGRHEIGVSAGVVVKLDEDGDGVFETTVAATDWQLEPVDADLDLPEAKPWTHIRLLKRMWPSPLTQPARRELVQVTARWGWPAVPADVRQACFILAEEAFKLRDAPFGVAGFDGFGAVRVRDNPKALNLLMAYRKHAVLVG